ncbi:CPBP family intramembrane glutamic endopeptidase [Streptomyces kurssanovii]|uniref:CPBP family intramembrane glutamic endopeptidase n=1 Tax=Streptomyces kurssanovii TaxID=67312 RepID=A0ABV3I4K5_9ACTN
MATTDHGAPPRRSALTRLRRHHAAFPLASAAVLFAALAVVRVAGAFSFTLMALSVALSAAVLLALPRERWAAAGLRRFAALPAVLCTVLVALVYAETLFATRAAFGDGEDNWTVWVPRLFEGLVPGTPWLGTAAMLLCMGVLVPLVEEVCYRGVLYRAVEEQRGTWAAIVSTSLAWSVVHLGDYGLNPLNLKVICGVLPSVFLMGLALGICRAVTGSALASACAQGACNLLLLWALAGPL